MLYIGCKSTHFQTHQLDTEPLCAFHGTSSNMNLPAVVSASDAMAPNVRRIWNKWGNLEPICAVARPTAVQMDLSRYKESQKHVVQV